MREESFRGLSVWSGVGWRMVGVQPLGCRDRLKPALQRGGPCNGFRCGEAGGSRGLGTRRILLAEGNTTPRLQMRRPNQNSPKHSYQCLEGRRALVPRTDTFGVEVTFHPRPVKEQWVQVEIVCGKRPATLQEIVRRQRGGGKEFSSWHPPVAKNFHPAAKKNSCQPFGRGGRYQSTTTDPGRMSLSRTVHEAYEQNTASG